MTLVTMIENGGFFNFFNFFFRMGFLQAAFHAEKKEDEMKDVLGAPACLPSAPFVGT